MNQTDFEAVVTIAAMAALADGHQDPTERDRLAAMVGRLGMETLDAAAERIKRGNVSVAHVARLLSDDDARQLAFNTATAICNADGVCNDDEQKFLAELGATLGIKPAVVKNTQDGARTLASASVTSGGVEVRTGTPSSDAGLDELILKQAMITGALEILPDQLANVAILPLQMRLVYQIGQRYGQQLDANQLKDLAGTLGIGAAAQMMEGVVRKVLGGVAGSILGGMVGGATGLAAGAAVTFGSTYALGHVARQYYAQGRRLSADDLRSLFSRFQGEAKALFPKVQDEIQAQARTLNLQSVLKGG